MLYCAIDCHSSDWTSDKTIYRCTASASDINLDNWIFMSDKNEKCPYCGANMKAYWHKMSKGLVNTLVKLLETARSKGQNHVILHEANLTNSEYSNITRLKFFGLIKKFREGVITNGWEITPEGLKFLGGHAIPFKVLTFRNAVKEFSPEVKTIHEIMKDEPYWYKKFETVIMMRKNENS